MTSGTHVTTACSLPTSEEEDLADEVLLSIDNAVDRLGYGRFQRRMLVAVGLCSASDAMEILLLSFLAVSLQADQSWETPVTAQQASSLISVVFLGAFVGTLSLGRLGDTWGRKPTFVLTAGIVATFGMLTFLCQTYFQLVAARFCVGLGIGGITIPFDTYCEFLPSRSRGKGLVLPSYFWTTGSVLVALLAKFTLGQDAGQWRWLCFWCSLPCLTATLVGFLFVPESPRFLLTQRQDPYGALVVLRKAAKENGLDPHQVFPPGTRLTPLDLEEEPAGEELATIPAHSLALNKTSQDADEDTSTSSSTTTVEASRAPTRMRSKSLVQSAVALLTIWFGYAFLYYGSVLVVTSVFSTVFTKPVEDAQDEGDVYDFHFDFAAIIMTSLSEVAGATLVILIIDRFGRRNTHGFCFGVGGIFVFSLCWVASLRGEASSDEIQHWHLRAASIVLAIFARMLIFCGSTITWIWTPELLSTSHRTTGHSLVNAGARIGGFLAPYVVSQNTPLPVVGTTMLVVSFVLVAVARILPETYGSRMGSAIVFQKHALKPKTSSIGYQNTPPPESGHMT